MRNNASIEDLVRRALEEDIGPGDITSEACVPESQAATRRVIAPQPLVIAGLDLLPLMYNAPHLLKRDGDCCHEGEEIATVTGTARRLLACERTALNFLQHLSGIATMARRFAEAVDGTNCRVLD